MARFFLKNPGFELGDRDWSLSLDFSIINDAVNARSGAWVGRVIGTGITIHPQMSALLPFRPGGKMNISGWLKGGTGGTAFVRLRGLDKDGADLGGLSPGGSVINFGGGYVQSTLDITVTNSRLKFIRVGMWFALPEGTWYFDDMDASGDIIETIPASAKIQSNRMIGADTVSAFDPLIGETKFSEFNAGMSDRWSGVYNFIPMNDESDLSELLAFIRRLGKRDRFFAYDPDHTTPINGVVNGMVCDGGANGGNTRIPVRGGPIDTTALVYGDYAEIRAQYFKVMRPLEIGPEGTGELIVWPSVRASIADGEDVITDNPKLVARITSEFDWQRPLDTFARLSMSWIEY